MLKPIQWLHRATNNVRQISTVPLAFDKWEPRKLPANPPAPIVFLHGLFGCKTNNRSAAKNISRALGSTVYCLDLRNHGDSPHAEPHNYAAMAADVREFIIKQSLTDPVLIGHSMGAKTVMELALADPKLPSAIIPVDNAPISSNFHDNFGKYIEGMMKVDKARCQQQMKMIQTMEPYCPDVAVQMFLLSNFKRDDNGEYRCRLPLQLLAKSLGNMADFHDFVAAESRYLGPTMFIKGIHSKFVTDEALLRIGELFPKFIIRDIDCGHWVISEKPKEFVDDVVQFLEKDD